MSVISAAVVRPTWLPISTIILARSIESSTIFAKRPEPVFTSRRDAVGPGGDLLAHDAGRK